MTAVNTGRHRITAYRLVPVKAFEGPVTTYAEKVRQDGGDLARNDANRLLPWHARAQRQRGFRGPPVALVAGEDEPEQADLSAREVCHDSTSRRDRV